MTFEGVDVAQGEGAAEGATGGLAARGLRTGLIVEVPAAESVVDRYRQQLDPMARLGVPAHITVLFPFVPASDFDITVTSAVQSLVGQVDRFSFELTAVDWFENEVLWLAPSAPDAFIRLTRGICAAFPAYQPYGGQFTGLVPHMTVADRAPAEAMHDAARSIRRQLPISCDAVSVSLMVEQAATGRWCKSASFPLQ